MERMKTKITEQDILGVLTLWRPWGWMIFNLPAHVRKDFENRDWRPPKGSEGKWLLFHAGKTWDDRGFEYARRIIGDIDRLEHDRLPTKIETTPTRNGYRVTGLTGEAPGMILGAVRLSAFRESSRSPWFVWDYGWFWDAAVPFEEPVGPVRGAQGIWKPVPEILEEVLEKINAAPL